MAAALVAAESTAEQEPRRRKTGSRCIGDGFICIALIAALSHLLLDWTNNYGVRPFFPFNPRWYAGSIVFIAEPVLWALLFMAMLMPWILGLADAEIGARKQRFRGRGWAIFALVGMVAVWGWRWSEQAQARASLENIQVTTAPISRMAFEPYPVNPYRWHVIMETPQYYQTAEVNTWTDDVNTDAHQDVIYKPDVTPAVEVAKQTDLGKVYLDWGTWAVVRDVGQEPVPGAAAAGFAARSDLDDCRIQRSAFCLLLPRLARDRRACSAGRMGLYRGQSRGSRRGHGQPGSEVGDRA